MSGVEVVPIALKLFPVLLKVLDDRFRLVEGMKDWWDFQLKYKEFLKSIRLQSLQYKNNILIFVSPLELEPEETRNLHENSDSALWHDPTIRARLRRRFGSEDYECFLDQLTTVSDALKELVAKIEITDVGTVEEEIYRLKFSFDNTWTSLLGKLTTANDELFKILHQDSLIIHHVEDAGYIKSCKKLQSHAKALYNILHTSLKCVDAAHTHNCSVSAEWSDTPTKGVHTPFLKVLFDRSPEWKQLRWEVEVSEVAPKPETGIAAGVSNREVITRAVREKKQREWHEDLVQHGKRHAIGIVTVAATLASVAPETDCPEKLWRERTPKKLKRKINVFGRKESALDKTVPDESDKNKHQSAQIPLETKPTRLVRFADSSSSSQTAPNEGEGFQQPPISDMCAFLHSPTPGRMKEDAGHAPCHHVAFHLEPDDQASLQGSSLQTLSGFISATRRLPDRVRLGLRLVRAVISYGESGWVPRPLDREKVFVLLDRNGDTRRATPYVTHDSLSQTLRMQETMDSRSLCKDVLFSLGVILLELADGKALEETAFWTEHAGMSPKWKFFIVAKQWQTHLQHQQPDDLCEPIRRCLDAAFSSVPHFGDSEFLREVFSGVVAPLEEFLRGWRD